MFCCACSQYDQGQGHQNGGQARTSLEIPDHKCPNDARCSNSAERQHPLYTRDMIPKHHEREIQEILDTLSVTSLVVSVCDEYTSSSEDEDDLEDLECGYGMDQLSDTPDRSSDTGDQSCDYACESVSSAAADRMSGNTLSEDSGCPSSRASTSQEVM